MWSEIYFEYHEFDEIASEKEKQNIPFIIQFSLLSRYRTINSFELQELLDACLPNDYIKSCASIDICRQVVSLLDVSLTRFMKLSCDKSTETILHLRQDYISRSSTESFTISN